MLLAVLSLAAWFGGVVGYLVGPVPFLIALLLCVFGVYVGFTVLHESVHRVAHRNRRINDGIGRPFAWLLWFNYPVFRTCHLRHHANTNDAVNDPDHWVSHGTTLTRPFYLLTTPIRYWVLSRRHGWLTRRQLWAQTGSYLLGWAAAGSMAISGNIGAVGILFLPTIVAGLILYYCLDYLPHCHSTALSDTSIHGFSQAGFVMPCCSVRTITSYITFG